MSWLCSAARGFSQPYPVARGSGLQPQGPGWCSAGARATGVTVAAPVLRAQQATSLVPSLVVAQHPGRHFSCANKAA